MDLNRDFLWVVADGWVRLGKAPMIPANDLSFSLRRGLWIGQRFDGSSCATFRCMYALTCRSMGLVFDALWPAKIRSKPNHEVA